MIRSAATTWLCTALLLAAAEAPDLLRFTNGDQLHGTYHGMKGGSEIVWQRADVAGNVAFQTANVRHVVLNGGRPRKSLTSLSHVALVNGDRIPGRITAMDGGTITLETGYAGTLQVPREQVAMLSPSPLGGRIRYHGPFVEDEWRMSHAAWPDGLPAPAAEGEDPDEVARWKFSGSAWYWGEKGYGTALVREDAMPERAILRFDVAWKNRLSLAVAFHADFAKPAPPEEEGEAPPAGRARARAFVPGDSSVLPMLFGNSYVLQIFSTHLMLFRSLVDEEGKPSVERVQINGSGVRLGESGKSTLEIRSNRATGEIALFIDGEFVVQWSEGAGPAGLDQFAGKGGGFGFVVQSDDSPVRISDVMVAEWNGMPDSARSLQVDEQDIVLLANGTDRFSGKVGGLEDGKIRMDGKWGVFQFELADIAEIRFARNSLAKDSEFPADGVVVRLSPMGQISGRPLGGDASALRLASPVAGDMNLNLESAVMLDFQQSANFIDYWDEPF